MDLPPVKSHLAQPLLREALLTLTLFRTSWQASFFKYWVSWKKKENLHSGFLSNHFSLSFFSLSVLHKHSNFTCESKKKKKKQFHFLPVNLCPRFSAACLMETFCLSDPCVRPTASLWRDDASVIAYQKKSRPGCQRPRSTSACLMAFSANEWIGALPWQDINTDTSSILMLCELPWFLSASPFHILAGDTSGDSGGDTAEIPNSIQRAQGSSIIHTRCRTDWIVTSRAGADGEDWREMSGSWWTAGLESSPPSWGRVHSGNNVTNLRLTLLRPHRHPSRRARVSQPHPVRRLAKTRRVFLAFFLFFFLLDVFITCQRLSEAATWNNEESLRSRRKGPAPCLGSWRRVKQERKKISNLSFCGWEENVVEKEERVATCWLSVIWQKPKTQDGIFKAFKAFAADHISIWFDSK